MSKRSSKLKDKQVVEKKPFNPQGNYQWQTDDVFAITGGQLDMLNKVIGAHLNTPETQRAIALLEASRVIGQLIRDGYDEGLVIEAPESEKEA
jgi:hypothetical protein